MQRANVKCKIRNRRGKSRREGRRENKAEQGKNSVITESVGTHR